MRQFAERTKLNGLTKIAAKYEEGAAVVDKEISAIREVIVGGAATKRQGG